MTALMLCCGLFAAEVSGAGAVDAAEPPIRLVLNPGHHTAPITALVFTPDSRQLVSASQDKTIRVWELASRKTLRVIRGESGLGNFGEIGAMALSPDGRLLAAAVRPAAPGKSAVIRLYDFAGGAQIGLLAGRDGDVHGLAFSPDGRHLISGGSDGTATIWGTDARKTVHVLKGHRGALSAVGFSPDGLRAITASQDRLRLWRVAGGALLREMTGHAGNVISMAIAADGAIASQDKTGAIRLWDGETGTFIRMLTPFPWPGALAFSPDGRELLVTCNDSAWCPANPQYVISTTTGRENANYADHDGLVAAGAISPDGHWAATGDDRNVHLWEPRPVARQTDAYGVPHIILGGEGNAVLAAAFATDGRQIAWGAREYGRLAHLESSAGLPPDNDRGPLQFAWTLPQKDDAIAAPQPLSGKWQSPWNRDESPFVRAASVHAGGGGQKPAIRVQIDPARLSAAGLTLEDVRGAVDAIEKNDQLFDPTQYDDLIIAFRNGAAIRVRDVGKAVEAGTDRTIAGFQNNRVRVLVKNGGSQGRRDASLVIQNGSHTAFVERDAASGSSHLACGITPDGKMVISGGKDGVLAAYDLDGRKLGDFVGHAGDVLTLAPSADGRYLVSGAGDQTLRLWNLQTYEPLVTLLYAADGEWAAWTPQGYYAASPRGGKLFGWQIDRGPEHNADYVAAERLRTRLYRPDVVARAIIVGSAKEAAARAAGNGPSLEELLGAPPLRP